ncbi:hypothetical protein H1215_15605 [Anoxybacillus sp. LAT_38]|uniref:hypothetical protein n=1 Tax=Anoxybacillus sp. LAT_26 TaxID=2862719 RepID=UPI001EEB98DA|nr:hypothetical protein [Anoxybacillus sp. LAT_26]MCG6184276.1 hypothetical protein [Anoxybacillus sp. LAT_26]MCG6198599.1 hypothetical protein [Anoxybacillus sp. LAT_38]
MNVLEKDRQLAEKIMGFAALCLRQARLEWLHGQLDEAERWAKEFLRCKRDLDELVRKKEEHDKLVQLVEVMKERGIDIAIVMRKGNE